MASQPAYATRTRWRNHTGNQSIDPLRIYTPRSLEELVEIVKEGERLRCPVRCVGSGHSWSDVALTPGFLVKPTGLTRRLELPDVRRDINGSKLVRFEAGIRIRELNAELERSGLALSNMGGYDGQTIAGVISTSTHGSGTSFGPLSDFVRSLDVVASGGAVHRIEPSDGPTDPERYRGGELHQDDDWFRAAVVGMGCMGLIYAVTLAVEPAYWLTETRTLTTWEEVGPALIDGSVLEENRHYELLFNPHRREGRNLVLVTQRNRAQRHPRRPPSRRRNSIPEFLALLPVTPIAVNLLVDLWPSLSPLLLDRALIALADEEYTSASHRVLNIGAANLLPAYSAEIGVPVDERGHHVE